MKCKNICAGIAGATGYAGAELVRILLNHPAVTIKALGSKSYSGQLYSDIYPGFKGSCDLPLTDDFEALAEDCLIVFGALPHGLSEGLADICKASGAIFIDLGADFRLEDEEVYKAWYGKAFDCPDLHKDAVYGLPELFREKISGSRLIANPGCYPTSVILGLYPALKNLMITTDSILADSKSGVTGRGRDLSRDSNFPECREGFFAYKAGGHRHVPEMEQELSKAAGSKICLTFTPHLIPVNRGILSTIYTSMKEDYGQIRKVYEETYADEPFIRVLPEGAYANIRNVRMTNCCEISLHQDPRTNRLIICSAIDNMVKGASGQAVQNMNLTLGLPETLGLSCVAPAF